jgi:hypothetical protein
MLYFRLLSTYEIEICAIHPEAVFYDRVNAQCKTIGVILAAPTFSNCILWQMSINVPYGKHESINLYCKDNIIS